MRLHDKSLAFQFSLKSKGGGITDVLLSINPENFLSVLSVMLERDRAQMLPLLADALKYEIERQAEIDKQRAHAARLSVLQAAERAFEEAPEGRNHAERLTRDMVKLLIADLEKASVSGGAGSP